MSSHITPLFASQSQPCCLVLIQSDNSKLKAVYLPIPSNQTPEAFMATLGQAYKTHTTKANRLFYRCVLSKKAAVSIAELTILTPSAAATVECPNLIRGYARDTILTDALHKPSVLYGADRTAFWEQYERVVIDAEQNERPKAAILIHLEEDPVVTRVFHVLGSVVSLTVALVAHFAM